MDAGILLAEMPRLHTEWAQSCAAEVLSEAKEGWLWRLPEPLLQGMEDLRMKRGCVGDERPAWDLSDAIRNIRLVTWTQMRDRHRVRPKENMWYTPIFDSWDFIQYDFRAGRVCEQQD